MDARKEEPGLFLVFEGVEGAGKSTQIELLAGELRRRGIPHSCVREPGSTEAGERIREIVLDAALHLVPEAELFLMLAARAQFVRRRVRPALEAGEVVIADRYELSTFAYQGGGRGLDLDRVRRLNEVATGGLRPDGLVFLELEPGEGRRRKGRAEDRMEREDAGFHGRVAGAYARLVREHPEWLARSPGDVIHLPADLDAEEVHRRLWAELLRRWPEVLDAST